MLESRQAQSTLFVFEKFRFTIRLTSQTVLPPYKGGIFRDALGVVLKGVVGCKSNAKCEICTSSVQCPFAACFRPSPSQNDPDGSKYRSASPPYIVNPPLTDRENFDPGETLAFELVLLGPAVNALPYFVEALARLGQYGLGKRRGRYDILKVEIVRGDLTSPIHPAITPDLSTLAHMSDAAVSRLEGRAEAVRIHCLTPLRLMENGHLTTRLTFARLFKSLVRRLTLLSRFYGTSVPPSHFSMLELGSETVKEGKYDLVWYDWERYSGRQKTSMRLGGLRGSCDFIGDMGPFLPYLRLGAQVNLGQGTVFGLGKYEVSVL